MQFLITGATGFVGGRLATTLLERGDRVRGLVRDVSRADDLRALGVEVVQGDMTNPDALRRAVQGIEYVVHTAAVVGDWPDRDETRRVNVEGTRSLMQAAVAAGVRRVVHFSSLAVYGNRHHHRTDESAPYRYGDTYTDAKIDSERVVQEFVERGDLEAVSLRPGFVYGPGDRTLIPRVLDALSSGAFAFVGDGSKQMNCVYVDDVVQATLLASSSTARSGAAYNITDGATPALRDFIGYIVDYYKLPMPTRRVPPAVAVPGCYASEYVGHLLHLKRAPLMNISRLRFLYYNQNYSIDRARRELGYAPRFTYRDGLPPTLDWFAREGRAPAGRARTGRSALAA
jgi:2-alkyl-3-oxoalkanoate reductase